MNTKVMEIKDIGTLTHIYLDSTPEVVNAMVLERNGRTYDLVSLLPKGWQINEVGSYGAHPYTNKVKLGREIGIDHLISSLHEIGHAPDYASLMAQGIDVGEINAKVLNIQSWINLRPDDIIGYLKLEYTAWEFALAFIRRLSLGQETLAQAYKLIIDYLQTNINGMFNPVYSAFSGRVFPSPIENVERNTGMPQEEQKQKILQMHMEFLERNSLLLSHFS